MKVNAQVTAMTSIIEAFGNILQWSIWIFITKLAGYGTLIQSILLYFVMLPYVFLMNTSQNKEQVIDAGWLQVLKNAFGNGKLLLRAKNWCWSKWKIDEDLVQSISLKALPTSKSANAVGSESQSKTTRQCIQYQEKVNNDQISTIFSINVPDYSDSLSNKSSTCNFSQRRIIVDYKIPRKNETLTWIETRHELLKRLMANVSSKEKYNGLIKLFFKFEDGIRIGDNNFNAYLDETNNFDLQSLKENDREQLDLLDNLNLKSEKYHQTNTLICPGDSEVKTIMRKRMIRKLINHYKNDEDIYEHYFENFVKMEETFIVMVEMTN